MAPGVYASYPTFFDATTVAAKRVPQGVVCLRSALYLHGLEPEPPQVWFAIGEKARRPRIEEPALRTVRFGGLAWTQGIEERTHRGVPVRVYSMAKTVVDLFRCRKELGQSTAAYALGRAVRAGLCTTDQVRHFAGMLHVWRVVEPYLQVLEHRPSPPVRRLSATP
ncbi:transcriptional regulator [Aggregicoccus sp. 17bor-14]|uniref:type IV toxin-antitoxin system AbiEi family antitoxin domain-containing protein n=1 Tax=Myxococcaceae TaxID=31 RepID=UPI00129CC261|nr:MULTISPECIES: transcriptional regulator [Myxococcaceae]MBF5045659.1 transcriptional regulator [Simulacricoccus sp. 17bor-14]MRI91396.1 transcriptional regulator [Aggregicoccus sp. 17bor-14]